MAKYDDETVVLSRTAADQLREVVLAHKPPAPVAPPIEPEPVDLSLKTIPIYNRSGFAIPQYGLVAFDYDVVLGGAHSVVRPWMGGLLLLGITATPIPIASYGRAFISGESKIMVTDPDAFLRGDRAGSAPDSFCAAPAWQGPLMISGSPDADGFMQVRFLERLGGQINLIAYRSATPLGVRYAERFVCSHLEMSEDFIVYPHTDLDEIGMVSLSLA